MALRLVSLLVTLVLMGVLATHMYSRGNTAGGSGPGSGAATPESLLRTTGMVVERNHQIAGEYGGVSIQDSSSIRLVSADANGYCLQLTWVDRQVYHLRGPGGQPAPGVC